MKKLLILFIVLLMSCSTHKVINVNYQSIDLLDSIFKAEMILTYDSLPLQDYETKENFWEYYFIRDSLVVRWIFKGDSVQIYKRIDK